MGRQRYIRIKRKKLGIYRMVIIILTNSPQRTRGYTSRYLLEITPTVYVGDIDAKTREKIWEYIRGNTGKTGTAVLCYTTNSSQGYSIKIQDNNPLTKNQKIQIDGIDVILKPTTPHTNNKNSTGWSKAWARKKYR